ncbi:hypothetical protein DYH09_03725 [bacterium CPR1]|nr:hypothetical protein [bacterium CPR1]
MEKKNPSAVHLAVSEMPRLIPAGSLVELEPARVETLRFGDVLYVDNQSRKVLCRFLRHWSSNGESMVMLAQPGLSHAIVLPFKSLIGKVKRVSHGSDVTEPNNESFLLRLLPKLTDYGTTSPMRKFFPGKR